MANRRFIAILGALALLGCGDDTNSPPDDTDSGFDSGNTESQGPTSNTAPPDTSNTTPDTSAESDDGEPLDPGTDDGEPVGPDEGIEYCDAGDEAFVKRLIPFVHGRRPESIREVRLLVSMIEQLDMQGLDGRQTVALGLMRGDQFLSRWKTYLYEELRVNRAGDRRNETCYDLESGQGDDAQLAEFIRDNTAEAQWPGGNFWMPDVVYSGLHLDDMSPIYRADLYARLSAPLIAANVTPQELEDMRLTNFGSLFEQNYLGRNTECLECHTTEDSLTDAAVEEIDRHFPVNDVELELAVWGPTAKDSDTETSYGIWRYFNFAVGQDTLVGGGGLPAGHISAFGFGPSCSGFRVVPGNAVLDWDPYLIDNFQAGDTLYDFDERYKDGFDQLRSGELDTENTSADSAEAAAYLTSMHFSNRLWTEAMGYPLTVANGFPRNPDQRDILRSLADSFVANAYSLRYLVAEIAVHDLFNQAAPAECTASGPYHLPAVYDPFTKGSTDPGSRLNGVGDGIHRRGAWVILDAVAQSMWWNKPDRFGPDTGQVPEFNCGGDMPQVPCDEEPEDATVLRDLGAFLSDSDSGFEGTDLLMLLRMEDQFGNGNDPSMHGECTGPLGSGCAGDDWIAQLIDEADSMNGADMWDVAAAVKDRLITEPTIAGAAEIAALEGIMGVDLTDTVDDVGAGQAEQAARRLVGVLVNTPQFVLSGVAPPDQNPAEDPILIVPGTGTEDLCNYLAALILDNQDDGVNVGYTCSDDGIALD